MQKGNFIIVGVLGILLVAAFVFYWYGIRPSNIRKECSFEAGIQTRMEGSRYLRETADQIYQDFYSRCLNEKGL